MDIERVRLGLWLSVLSGVLVIAGCARPGLRPEAELPPDAARPQIEVMGELEGRLDFAKPSVDGGRAYPLEVAVPVRLRADEPREARYRFVFFDQAGRPHNADEAWRTVRLPGQLVIELTGSAATTAARDWQVQIKPAARNKADKADAAGDRDRAR